MKISLPLASLVVSSVLLAGCTDNAPDSGSDSVETSSMGRHVASKTRAVDDASDDSGARAVAVAPAGSNGGAGLAGMNPSNGPRNEQTQTLLPLESKFLSGGVLNESALSTLKSDGFERFFDEFQAQNARLGGELTPAYRVALDETLKSIPGASAVDRISCAKEICIAVLRAPDSASWYATWYENLQKVSPLPINTLTAHRRNLPNGGAEMRLLFTTGENSRGGFVFGPAAPSG